MTLRLVLVRHGETTWSKNGQHTGRTDIALTAAGRAEAATTAATLARFDFGSVFSSPLQRATETAELAGFPDAAVDPDLMEWDYGEVEGQRNEDVVAAMPNWSKWDDEVPGGEQVADVGGRADRFLGRIAHLDHDVAVFAHGHLLSILIARWLDLSPVQGKRFPLATATISVLAYKRCDRVIEMVNHHCTTP